MSSNLDLHCEKCNSFILTEKKSRFEKNRQHNGRIFLSKNFQGNLPYTLEYGTETECGRPHLLCSACKSEIGLIDHLKSNINGNPIITILIDSPCLIAYENKDDESDVER